MNNIGLSELATARRMVTNCELQPGGLTYPPVVNMLVTFADEKTSTAYKALINMEKEGLVSRYEHPPTWADVTETDWALTQKGLAWFFWCKDTFFKYLDIHNELVRARDEVSAQIAIFEKKWKEGADDYAKSEDIEAS